MAQSEFLMVPERQNGGKSWYFRNDEDWPALLYECYLKNVSRSGATPLVVSRAAKWLSISRRVVERRGYHSLTQHDLTQVKCYRLSDPTPSRALAKKKDCL